MPTKKTQSSKRKAMKREYERLYREMQKTGQTTPKYRQNVTRKDINRLKERIQTVKEYDKIRRRFEKSVAGFNDKYYEDVKIKPMHNVKDKRTLNFLKEEYEEWKATRRRYVRTLPKEIKIVTKNIEDMYKDIDQDIRLRADSPAIRVELEDRRDETKNDIRRSLVVKMAEKILRSKSILSDWKAFVFSINRYIFYSGQDAIAVRNEARTVYLSILENKPVNVAMVSPEYDSVIQ